MTFNCLTEAAVVCDCNYCCTKAVSQQKVSLKCNCATAGEMSV